MLKDPVIVLFRQDLRLSANPALDHAIRSGAPVVCVYLYNDASPYQLNPRQKHWVALSLHKLDQSLKEKGNRLIFIKGGLSDFIQFVIKISAKDIFWNKRYTPVCIKEDLALEAQLTQIGVCVHSFNSFLFNEPWAIETLHGTPYQKFSPYAACVLKRGLVGPVIQEPPYIKSYISSWKTDSIEDWLGQIEKFKLEELVPGEQSAQKQLVKFINKHLAGYHLNRDYPGKDVSSKLSIYLHHGEISVWQILSQVESAKAPKVDKQCYIKELLWREFNYHLLNHYPPLQKENFNKKFDKLSWSYNEFYFDCWKKGKTGYPLVDAGMNQLVQTGWMHNRVRMITASFLTKHLGIHWSLGEQWFYKQLLDADEANNAANWQWVAGTGADAAPYTRIFNPILQAEKFDPSGEFIRRYITERRPLTDSYVLSLASSMCSYSGCEYPIIEHAQARVDALKRFASIKNK